MYKHKNMYKLANVVLLLGHYGLVCRGQPSATTGSGMQAPSDDKKPKRDELEKLPIWFAFNDDKTYTPCYLDKEGKKLYVWKDIRISSEVAPIEVSFANARILVRKRAQWLTEVVIDPPLCYLQVDADHVAAGYLDYWMGYFLRLDRPLLKRDSVDATLIVPNEIETLNKVKMKPKEVMLQSK